MKAKLVKDSNSYWLDSNDEVIKDFLQECKLSKENCDEIFGVVNVEILSDEYSNDSIWLNRRGGCNDQSFFEYIAKKSFKDGFNKAMELYQPKVINVDVKMKIVKEESTKNSPAKTFKLDDDGCLILNRI